MSPPQPETTVTPLAAASVLLLRDAPEGLEVLMMERHAAMGFAAGAMVFPGGKIDASDGAAALVARANLSDVTDLNAFRLGALRELFE
ncbi:MAG: NUDIX hydrolase, partial [Proteobacteria bacterium]|nr:NUDIX hydrolase [Pseudomonadota bacterium]